MSRSSVRRPGRARVNKGITQVLPIRSS